MTPDRISTDGPRDGEHNIYATLLLGPSMKHRPLLGCSCGFSAHEDTWEEAGAVFDEHVATLGVDA